MIYTPYSDINVRLIRTNHAWLSSSMYTAQHIDSTARSHVRLFKYISSDLLCQQHHNLIAAVHELGHCFR